MSELNQLIQINTVVIIQCRVTNGGDNILVTYMSMS